MSIISYVVETELALKALKDEREILQNSLRNLEIRNQILVGAIKLYKQEKAEEETKRAHAEFRLQLALANIELLRREQAEGRGYEHREEPDEENKMAHGQAVENEMEGMASNYQSMGL